MGLISRRKPVPKVSTAPLAAPHPAQEAESLPDEQAAAGLANADTDDEEEPLYNNPAVDFNHPTAVRPSENDTAISEDTEENVMPPTENDWKADEEACNKGRATLDENQGGNPCITKKKSRANPVAEPRATHGSKCPEDKVAPALRLVKRSKSKQPCEDSDVLDEACTACGRTDGGMHMLLCDGAHCSAAWHMGCLEPPLKQLPRGNWYCPDCTERHIAKRLKRANAKSSSGSSSSSSSSLVAPPPVSQKAASAAWRSGLTGMALAGTLSQDESECLAGAAHALGIQLLVGGSPSRLPEDISHVVVASSHRASGGAGAGGGSSLPMRAYLGMARGLWLLSSDYIYRSLEAGAWLPEEPFELTYCGCRESRLRRRPSHGSDRPSKNQPILGRTARGVLHGVRLAFSTTYLPVSDLGELVRAADGEVAAFRTAHVLMTDAPEGTLPAALKRMAPGLRPAVRPSKWLFDVVSGGTDDVLDDVVARALGGGDAREAAQQRQRQGEADDSAVHARDNGGGGDHVAAYDAAADDDGVDDNACAASTRCALGHEMTRIRAEPNGLSLMCDGSCGHMISPHLTRFTCDVCGDYDLCAACAAVHVAALSSSVADGDDDSEAAGPGEDVAAEAAESDADSDVSEIF